MAVDRNTNRKEATIYMRNNTKANNTQYTKQNIEAKKIIKQIIKNIKQVIRT